MKTTVLAPAKLNLTLDVVGKREDGYHLLDMLVQMVDLCDVVTVSLNNTGSITLEETSGRLPTDEGNIAYKAARLILDRAKSQLGAHITIEKNIPLSAGLGGGSCDAAAVLRAVNAMLGSPFSLEQLAEMSVTLGADVPMCVLGGCMRARGIGEELERVKNLPECYIVITKNGQKPSTGYMYKRMGELGYPRRPDTEAVLKAVAEGDLEGICRELYNVFLPAAMECGVGEDIELLRKTDAMGVGLSGSGPSVFAIYKSEDSAKIAAEKLRSAGKTAYICRPTE